MNKIIYFSVRMTINRMQSDMDGAYFAISVCESDFVMVSSTALIDVKFVINSKINPYQF